MTITIDQLADALQALFTTDADEAAKDSGMIRSRCKLPPGPDSSRPWSFIGWRILTPPLRRIIEDLDISEAAFNERFPTPAPRTVCVGCSRRR